MNIYELEATRDWTSSSNYDAGDAYTVKYVMANSEKEARKLAAMHTGDEGKKCWLSEKTICRDITNEEAQVLGML